MQEKPVVLIVDDAPQNIQTLAQCLKDDYRLKIATDGARCLQLAQADPVPDLVLLDVNMPGMSGYEVLERFTGSPTLSTIPVIFVTAMDDDADEEKGLKLGAVDYVIKPVRPAIVRARVQTHVTLKQQKDQLKKMAMCDQLTGLYNRHFLISSARQKIAFCKRHRVPLSVMLLDINHFKGINDQHGHAKGDEVLQAVSETISECCREEDLLGRPAQEEELDAGHEAARYGGEEFVVMMSPCGLASAEQKAEQLRATIEAAMPSGITTTVSIGVAELKEDESFEALLNRADEALYRAKEAGRNRVMVDRSAA